MINNICPLLSMACHMDCCACAEDNCAWWDFLHNQCAMMTLADSAEATANAVMGGQNGNES